MSQVRRRSDVNLEIRVHASAPSRGTDDTRYRALAAAYAEFVPAKRIAVFVLGVDGDGVEDGRAGRLLKASQLGSDSQDSHVESLSQTMGPTNLRITRLYANSSQMRLLRDLPPESPQMSFNSVLDNRDSPVIRQQAGARRDKLPADASVDGAEDSWNSPPSEVLNSQSTFDRAIPEFSSPTRVLRLYLQNLPPSSEPDLQSDGGRGRDRGVVRSQGVAKIGEWPIEKAGEAMTSSPQSEQEDMHLPFSDDVVPQDIPSAQPHLAVANNGNISLHYPNVDNPRQQVSSDSPSRILNTPDRPAGSGPFSRFIPPLHTHERKPPDTSIQPVVAQPSSSIRRSEPPHHALPPLKKRRLVNPNNIRPPIPATNLFTTSLEAIIMTPGLAKISESFQSIKRSKPWFCPQEQSRELRKTERGYWCVPTAAWPDGVRDRAWQQLRRYIEGGSAGWNVWAVRSDDGGKGKGREGDWRIYCWGGVIEAVWLLLYMASERRVKEVGGARWYDAEGQCIVAMA